MKVPANDDRADPQTGDENSGDEFVRAHYCKRGVEAHENDAIESEAGADFAFVPSGRQPEYDRPSGEKVGRVRLERQDGARNASLVGHRDGALDHRPMPEMQAVKISDGVNRAFKPMRRLHRVRGEHETVGHGVLQIPGFRPTYRKARKLPRRPRPVKPKDASAWVSEER